MSDHSQPKPPEKPVLKKPMSFDGHAIVMKVHEPWPEPVNGDLLISDLVRAIQKYVVMQECAAITIAIWIIHTYVFDVFLNSPILAIYSPEKQCGKTTLLDILNCLVRGAQMAANISAALLFRIVDAYSPTLLMDEGDTFIGGDKVLQGVINSGHRMEGEVFRLVGENYEPRAFCTFSPKAIASIKKLPDTLQDRAISIELKRRRQDEVVSRFSAYDTEELDVLARKITRWTDDHREALRTSNPDIPDFLFNRSADNWRPLLAIADEVGHE